MEWVDRNGNAQPLADVPAGPYRGPRLSPDGRKIVVNVRHPTNRLTDVWIYDVLRGAPTRLTFSGGGQPLWSPDGKRIVYGTGGLSAINADGGGKPEPVTVSDTNQIPSSWASTNMIAFLQRTQNGTNGIWVLPMAGERKPTLFGESPFTLWHPEFSPDGRWIAYVSNEVGSPEVYVRPYPGPGEKIRISTTGGSEPIWTANGDARRVELDRRVEAPRAGEVARTSYRTLRSRWPLPRKLARPLSMMTGDDNPATIVRLPRRRSSIRPVRATALEAGKGIELETRVGRLEVLLKDIRAAVDVLNKRTAAVQAHLDHLSARVDRR
jgi:Tol biopolymer transport system component